MTNHHEELMELNHSSLHHHIMSHIVSRGFAPRIAEMQAVFEVTQEAIVTALQALQEYHGVVLHPNSSEVWVMHPFATTATNFWIQSGSQSWWGNCAWCSLGAAALLDPSIYVSIRPAQDFPGSTHGTGFHLVASRRHAWP